MSRPIAFRGLFLAALVIVAAGAGGCRGGSRDSPPAPPDAETANAAALAWRAKHAADYRRDWVTIAGFHPLKPGPNTAGSAATNDIVLPPSTPPALGRFELNDQRVRFEPAAGVRVLLNDQPVTATIDVRDDRSPDTDELVVGDVRLVVHVSGDTRAIRVRDPSGALARGFLGFAWFPIDAHYRVVGRFIKDATPQRFKVANTYGDVDEYNTDGVVEFELRGERLRLRPFTTRPGRLYFVFRDA